MIYLDNNGTTFLLDEVKDRIAKLLAGPLGNPAANSASGEIAAGILRTARENVAALIEADPRNIIFTSSGSEANVSVVRSVLKTSGRPAVVTSEIEHASLRELWPVLRAEGFEIRIARTLSTGQVDIDHMLDLIDESVGLVSLQAVNNETGVIQPYEIAGETAHRVGARFHTDAAQAVGKTDFSVSGIPADYVTFTGHKFHAPSGVGAVYSREGWETFAPLVQGGSQEFGARGGTHNLLGIAALGEAARARKATFGEATARMRQLRNMFEETVLENVDFAKVNGVAERACNTVNLLFEGIDGKALFAQLQDSGIECSQSSACTAQYPEPSKVLRAMGLDYHQAFSSIRFSFSVLNDEHDANEAARVVSEKAHQIRSVLGGVW
jgi:cysteine desulfurase